MVLQDNSTVMQDIHLLSADEIELVCQNICLEVFFKDVYVVHEVFFKVH